MPMPRAGHPGAADRPAHRGHLAGRDRGAGRPDGRSVRGHPDVGGFFLSAAGAGRTAPRPAGHPCSYSVLSASRQASSPSGSACSPYLTEAFSRSGGRVDGARGARGRSTEPGVRNSRPRRAQDLVSRLAAETTAAACTRPAGG
jgi:hypothetical protein